MKWKPGKRWSDKVITSYELDTGKMKISVHRHIGHEPDAWLLSCHSAGIVKRELKSKIDLHARSEALEMVRTKLKGLIDSLPEQAGAV